MDYILENSTVSMLNFLSFDNSTMVTVLVFRKYILKNLGVREDVSATYSQMVQQQPINIFI